jgi:hypothetical protein
MKNQSKREIKNKKKNYFLPRSKNLLRALRKKKKIKRRRPYQRKDKFQILHL